MNEDFIDKFMYVCSSSSS